MNQAIGLLSRYSFIHGLFGWLEDIWASMYVARTINAPALEWFVHRLLTGTALPDRGNFVTFVGPLRTHYGYHSGEWWLLWIVHRFPMKAKLPTVLELIFAVAVSAGKHVLDSCLVYYIRVIICWHVDYAMNAKSNGSHSK